MASNPPNAASIPLKGSRFSTFRARLTFFIVTLVIASVGSVSVYLLRLYRADRLGAAYTDQLNTIIQSASRMESLLLGVSGLSSDRIEDSRDILALIEAPCSTVPTPVFSKYFREILDKQKIALDQSIGSMADRVSLCQAVPSSATLPGIIAQGSLHLAIPYLIYRTQGMTGERWAVISLESVDSGSISGGLQLFDGENRLVWSSPNAQQAPSQVSDVISRALHWNSPGLLELGGTTLLSYSPVASHWVMVRAVTRDVVLKPVNYAVEQLVILLVALVALCVFFARRIASTMAKPLQRLSLAAEKLGQGDLDVRVPEQDRGEIGVLERTFNGMAKRIAALLVETVEKSKLESEMMVAQQVQKTLLPQPKVIVTGHEINSYVQMAQRCGGDWWGVLEAPVVNGKSPIVLLLIGDATGHGTPSALVTAAAQGAMAIVSGWIEKNPGLAEDPREVLRLFNRAVYHASSGAIQMSFFAASIDRDRGTLVCSNAAHNRPYLLGPGPDGALEVKPLGGAGMPLGQRVDTVFEDLETHPWTSASQVFLYTDGLIDCIRDKESLFERRHLVRLLKKNGKLRGKALLDQLLRERQSMIGSLPQEDDVTVVVCRMSVGDG
jgi:serine phosphatase RsbU (regulator of sigma subunit)